MSFQQPGVLLSVQGLCTSFRSGSRRARAVDGVSFAIRRGETLALVGESGSGKSVTALSVLRLLDPGQAESSAESMMFAGRNGAARDLMQLSDRDMRGVRGNEIAMIFQEPMSSLNPLLTVGEQIAEVLRLHRGMDGGAAWREAGELLARVNVPDALRRLGEYPHRLSGGLRQRVMIAMALACRPQLLIADEPTTALDVTVQAQILALLQALAAEFGMGMLFITHNLGVVAGIADRVAVMYTGRIVEQGTVADVFDQPRHPYTRALLNSLPRLARQGPMPRLSAIPGQVPSPAALPPGCSFAPRCALAAAICARPPEEEAVSGPGHSVRCWHWRGA